MIALLGGVNCAKYNQGYFDNYIHFSLCSSYCDCLDAGLSAITGGVSGGSDTYWSKNKGRSAEGALKRATTALAVLFIILSVVLNLKVW